MMNSPRSILLSLVLALPMSGCIGTDIIDEPLSPSPSEIILNPSALALLPGQSENIQATVLTAGGIELNVQVSWLSRDTSVATVNESGLLSAFGTGQVFIIAMAETIKDSVLVTVVADQDAVASVEIEGNSGLLEIGETMLLTAVVRNVNGDEIEGKSVSWSSSNPLAASVDQNGIVTGVASGNVTIRAEAEGIISSPFAIEVQSEAIERRGVFTGLNGYDASGTTVLRVQGNTKTLLFEDDFATQNGPGLFIYLSPNANNVSGGVNLGQIKSTSGSQTYNIPSAEDTDQYDHVIIYCQPFGVPFGTAALQ
jgi:hypothetical protein